MKSNVLLFLTCIVGTASGAQRPRDAALVDALAAERCPVKLRIRPPLKSSDLTHESASAVACAAYRFVARGGAASLDVAPPDVAKIRDAMVTSFALQYPDSGSAYYWEVSFAIPGRRWSLAVQVDRITARMRAAKSEPWIGQMRSACLPDTAAYAITVRDGLADLLGGTSSDDSIFRRQTDLPQVERGDVSIVQADSLCSVAAAALVTAWGSGSPSDGTWVIRVGPTRYVVFNQRQVSGGRASALVVDTAFVNLGSFIL